ncbi:hypothetical protein PV326_013082 [Microctonus aethiopoides]|nr:hypothetical protein PV326_013082 [Microctonus aethiopoides]
MDSQTNDPVIPPPVEVENASGTIPIDEVEMMRRRVSAQARELTPIELLTTMDVFGLSCKGTTDILTDRLVRAELRKSMGEQVAEWIPEVDERDGPPRTVTGLHIEPSFDEVIEKARSGQLDISRNSAQVGPAPNREQNRRREFNPVSENNIRESESINRFENIQILPSGQSMGRFRDPISFSQDEEELGAQYMPTTSGYNNQTPLSGTNPTTNQGRTTTITFADGYRLASSPAVNNQRRDVNSTRIIESVERRERRYPVLLQMSEQLPQLPQIPEQLRQPPPVNNTSWF